MIECNGLGTREKEKEEEEEENSYWLYKGIRKNENNKDIIYKGSNDGRIIFRIPLKIYYSLIITSYTLEKIRKMAPVLCRIKLRK
jgi:hypothetical protein